MLAAQAQPTASTEKTVSDGIAIINETPAVQPVVPAIQIPQEIIQNSTAQPQTSTTKNSQAVTAQDEALDKTPAKVETKRKGKTYAKTSSRRKAKVNRTKTAVVRTSEEQAAKNYCHRFGRTKHAGNCHSGRAWQNHCPNTFPSSIQTGSRHFAG